MTTQGNVAVVMAAIAAVEQRDLATLERLYAPDIEFVWPPGLPYSGTHRGEAVSSMTGAFAEVWGPLQPTAHERRTDAVLVSASGHCVTVRYTWRGRSQLGRRFVTDILAIYQVRDGRLAKAEMFYFDHAGLCDFVAEAAPPDDEVGPS